MAPLGDTVKPMKNIGTGGFGSDIKWQRFGVVGKPIAPRGDPFAGTNPDLGGIFVDSWVDVCAKSKGENAICPVYYIAEGIGIGLVLVLTVIERVSASYCMRHGGGL
jgi:hypothetical protein